MNSSSEWPLSVNKLLTYEFGDNGQAVRLWRDEVFIYFNKNVWRKFRGAVPVLRRPGFSVSLTSFKRVFNQDFEGKMYITFEHSWKGDDGEQRQTFINLSMEELDELVKNLWQIDQLIRCFKIQKCFVCNDISESMDMVDFKLAKTLLDDKTYKKAMASKKCSFCGDPIASNECHCHKFNCRRCSSENFCPGCGNNMFRPQK
jgi:hypothetical protein